MNYQETYTAKEFVSGTKREARQLLKDGIAWVISANNIKEDSQEWHRLMELKTYVEQQRGQQ